MCGIAGILRRRGFDELDPSRLRAMTEAIVHRGPDNFGYLLLNSRDGRFQIGQAGFEHRPCDVHLGNRRLSIIDLSENGRQPTHNETSDIFVVFNGEVFNYLELRAELVAKGHVFRSQTDTEVIVHAYEEWGADCVTRFNGMWAFALWDQRKRELFCSRDRFGIKPFYYYIDDDVFLFASEIKGILPALNARPSADYGVISDYLQEGSLCCSPDTFFEGIKRLDSANNFVVSAERVRSTRYWHYRCRSQSYDDHRPVETFRELLHEAVGLRLRSDVPVGIALSGGLDSTSILADASRGHESRQMKAFTAVFPGEPFDEHEYARLAAQESGAELFTIDYQPDRFIEDLRGVIWSMDYPSLEGQVLPRWQIMRLASKHVKVILEGQGADEMLAGYTWRCFGPHLLDELGRLRFGERLPRLRKVLGACRHAYHQGRRGAMISLLQTLLPRSLPPRTYGRLRARNRVYTREFMGQHSARRAPPLPRQFPDRLTNLLHYDHMTRALPMLLKFGDALSMASSLESRLPFLDHRLVEFTFGLPVDHKLDGSLSKGVLREAMAGVIPERIRSRRDKVGFSTPLGRWISPSMDSDIRPLLLSGRSKDRGILDMKKLDRQLAHHARGPARLAGPIFRWLSVELWFRMFIDGEGPP